jgi:hypothetical protein
MLQRYCLESYESLHVCLRRRRSQSPNVSLPNFISRISTAHSLSDGQILSTQRSSDTSQLRWAQIASPSFEYDNPSARMGSAHGLGRLDIFQEMHHITIIRHGGKYLKWEQPINELSIFGGSGHLYRSIGSSWHSTVWHGTQQRI